ncbi:MAG: RNA polymerase sigma factor [Bacteroidales bacterium]|nr:RNA polymerase sigma factor [Bacteroidales bacterium]HOY38469.1 RNA polymerase sigma factor [Bacteroidales bacterium]HQN93576.1 RNA polymerase sigma factor [Prolixibacteraceae bacterium]
MSPEKEQEIIRCFVENKDVESAFRTIVVEYGPRLYSHIRKMLLLHHDTDDVLQETFIKAYHNLSNFRHDSKIFTWLYRIATNETLNFLKKKKRQHVFSDFDYENYMINSLKEDPYFDGDELQINIQKAIMSLPEKQRLVFNMRYYDDLPYHKISEILGTSEGALKASYHHAVKKLEKTLNLT